jgi:NAD(P)-dependent dehydrogenase (short-subunit alcohol dehydrogenase family)
MLLKDKVAVVYGAGGPIGAAIAHHFAAAGALVHLAGRTEPKLRARAEEIGADGGLARTATPTAMATRRTGRRTARRSPTQVWEACTCCTSRPARCATLPRCTAPVSYMSTAVFSPDGTQIAFAASDMSALSRG